MQKKHFHIWNCSNMIEMFLALLYYPNCWTALLAWLTYSKMFELHHLGLKTGSVRIIALYPDHSIKLLNIYFSWHLISSTLCNLTQLHLCKGFSRYSHRPLFSNIHDPRFFPLISCFYLLIVCLSPWILFPFT